MTTSTLQAPTTPTMPTTLRVGTLTIDDNGVHDPAITDSERDCLIGCGATTDHASGVCDGCATDEGMPATEEDIIAA